MKKRLTAILLTVCLLFGMLILPAKAENKAAWQYLADYAQSSGGKDRGFKIPSSAAGTLYFYIVFDPGNNSIKIRGKLDQSGANVNKGMIFDIIIPASLKKPYTLVGSNTLFGEAYSSKSTDLNPASYTEATQFSGFAFAEDAVKVVPDILEAAVLVLYDGGYSLKDLGFDKFTRHTMHNAGPSRVTKQPTCVAYGELTTYCAVCGAPVLTNKIYPTGNHIWDQGTYAPKPNCSRAGIMKYTCTVCGQNYIEELPPNGEHIWDGGADISAPGCTEPGVLRYTCELCRKTKDQPIPALGHVWKPSELTEQGLTAHDTTEKYVCERCGEYKEARLCAGEIFTDMPKDGNYAHDPIDWAYFHDPQITSGMTATSFSPKGVCTRAQVVTFLWRAAGEPKAENENNPFTDVPEKKYYTDAVLWSVEHGVTTGTTATSFDPNGKCTRAQVVTFLWRAAGKPKAENEDNPFADVAEKKYYTDAVLWAVEKGVTTGISADRFDPNGYCTRAQVVTFLYRGR